jgi:hypothetical protein
VGGEWFGVVTSCHFRAALVYARLAQSADFARVPIYGGAIGRERPSRQLEQRATRQQSGLVTARDFRDASSLGGGGRGGAVVEHSLFGGERKGVERVCWAVMIC